MCVLNGVLVIPKSWLSWLRRSGPTKGCSGRIDFPKPRGKAQTVKDMLHTPQVLTKIGWRHIAMNHDEVTTDKLTLTDSRPATRHTSFITQNSSINVLCHTMLCAPCPISARCLPRAPPPCHAYPCVWPPRSQPCSLPMTSATSHPTT